MAYVTVVGQSKTTISAIVVDLDTSFAYQRRFEWYVGGQYHGNNYSPPGAFSSPTYTFTGLSPGTGYSVMVVVYRDDNDQLLATFYTSGQTEPDIEPWVWYYPKYSGGDFNVTRNEWLDFASKINEIRIANGLNPFGFTYTTEWVSQGRPFYAWIFQEAVVSIDALGTGVAAEVKAVSSGSTCYAWYFNNLQAALNAAI